MGRVTKPGGVVSASVWDFAGGRRRCRCSGRPPRRSTRPRPARPTGPGRVRVRSSRSPATPACATSGLTSLTVRLAFTSYDEWWAPYLDGVGWLGVYAPSLDPKHRRRSRGALPVRGTGRHRAAAEGCRRWAREHAPWPSRHGRPQVSSIRSCRVITRSPTPEYSIIPKIRTVVPGFKAEISLNQGLKTMLDWFEAEAAVALPGKQALRQAC